MLVVTEVDVWINTLTTVAVKDTIRVSLVHVGRHTATDTFEAEVALLTLAMTGAFSAKTTMGTTGSATTTDTLPPENKTRPRMAARSVTNGDIK